MLGRHYITPSGMRWYEHVLGLVHTCAPSMCHPLVKGRFEMCEDDGWKRAHNGLGENNGKDDGVGKISKRISNVDMVWVGLASIANNGEISQPEPRKRKRSED